MFRVYICEDGNDSMIESFESAFSAIEFAKEQEEIKEVFEYVEKDMDNFEVVGLIYKKEV